MNEKRQWVWERCRSIALWEGLDDALIGVVTRCGQADPIAVYEREAIIRCLSEQMNVDDAVEWIDYNINGAWIGDHTPYMLDLAPSSKNAAQRFRRRMRAAQSDEVARLRAALEKIAEMKDEPYCSEFARDILERRAQ
jgi:hypothetical protein